MTVKTEVEWIGEERILPNHGSMVKGRKFFTTEKIYKSLKKQGLVKLVTKRRSTEEKS